MNELERIVGEAAALRAQRRPFLLATVVRVAGSSYRRPGARMLVAEDRWIAGCVSGGCLEHDVMLRGAHHCRRGPTVVTYDSTDDGEPWATGLGCNGIVEVLLEQVEPGAEHPALAFAQRCFEAERTGTLATVIRSAIASAPVGMRLAIGPRGEVDGRVADASVRARLEEAARGAPGVVELAGGDITALVERIAPSPQLFVFGSGFDTAPIVTLAQSVGMRVVVIDRVLRDGSRLAHADRLIAADRSASEIAALLDSADEAYVVVKHHRREDDRQALVAALASRAAYVGVLGPARRTAELLRDLRTTPQDESRLHAPVGLDIGAETPEQIALAIVAEIEAVRQRRSGAMLRGQARGLHAQVAVAVLAAGASRRLGRPKQLVEIGGTPLVRLVASSCIAARMGPVSVLVGAHAAGVSAALGGLPLRVLANGDWESGMASSVRSAVAWAETTSADALAIVLVDQPRLDAAHLLALRERWRSGAGLVASRFAGVVGAPAVFDRSRWEDLRALVGDSGAGRLLRERNVAAVDWPDGAVDVDTAEDLAAVAAR